ncbi:MAG: formate/nitrite transporter family protein [Dehalococcoidia bacterium]
MVAVSGLDAYAPKEIATRLAAIGATKARLPLLSTVTLGILAGGFIALGALYYTLVASDPSLGFALGRVLGGVVFSLGLVLVVVAGAELFTGNNLLVMAWVARRITAVELFRNLGIVFVANLAGAVGLALVVILSGEWRLGGEQVGQAAVGIAAAKTALPLAEAFFRAVLCNVLVCLAVWMALAGRSVTDKVLAVVFPISAFVAAGLEHSVANMYFIPLGILLRDQVAVTSVGDLDALTWAGFVRNMVTVTLGNIVGGSVMVGLVFAIVYRRDVMSGALSAGERDGDEHHPRDASPSAPPPMGG